MTNKPPEAITLDLFRSSRPDRSDHAATPGEERPGFKFVKRVGWVPADWSAVPLRQLTSKVRSGVSVNGEDRPAAEGEVGVLRVSAVTYGDFRPYENKAVIEDDLSRVKRPVRKGTILVSRANTTALVGASAFVEQNHPNLFLPDKLWEIRPADPKRVSTRWLSYVLAWPRTRWLISSVSTGSSASMKNVSQTDFLHIRVPTPPPHEQRKIARILNAWDRTLADLDGLIEVKRQRLDELTRRMLSARLRFTGAERGAWRKMALSEFLRPVARPVDKPQEPYTGLGIRSHGKGTFLKPDQDPAQVSMDTLYRVESGDLLVNITFAWEGAIAIAGTEDEGALTSHRFPAYRIDKKKVLPGILKYVIRQPRFVHYLRLVSPGGAGRNRVMSKKDFLDITIGVPHVEEQRQIAAVLNAADAEIAVLEAQRDALARQKRGLMQRLLTGEVRVTPDARDL